MARDDKRRKSFWEEDEEKSSKPSSPDSRRHTGSLGVAGSEVIDAKIHDAKVLIEQTNQLYQMYINGVEKRPPIEKANLLETKVKELERLSAATATGKFKISQFLMHYKTMRDLWDRKLKNLEKK